MSLRHEILLETSKVLFDCIRLIVDPDTCENRKYLQPKR
jgi:hypothetical protein